MQSLLHHGAYFLNADTSSDVSQNAKSEDLLYLRLSWHRWNLEDILLTLQMQGKNGFPAQNLDGCLHLVLMGSNVESYAAGVQSALVALINTGADVWGESARFGHRTPSQVACMDEKIIIAEIGIYRPYASCCHRRWKAWVGALTECGYHAEDFVGTDRVEEICDCLDYHRLRLEDSGDGEEYHEISSESIDHDQSEPEIEEEDEEDKENGVESQSQHG